MKTTHGFASAILSAAFLITSAAVQRSIGSTPQDILNDYVSVWSGLTQDSMKNVRASAQALAEAARGDETQLVPTAVTKQVEALAKAKSLAKARKAFQALSQSLVAYFKANGVPSGVYYEVYCPVAKASWLQPVGIIRNPYLGARSATPTWGWACAGVVKAKLDNRTRDKS